MTEKLMMVSADGHAGAPLADYRPYVESAMVDEYEAFLVAREEWRRERNRSMGLPEDGELVHALFGKEMVDMWEAQDAVAEALAKAQVKPFKVTKQEEDLVALINKERKADSPLKLNVKLCEVARKHAEQMVANHLRLYESILAGN